jgi:hypothetical protein
MNHIMNARQLMKGRRLIINSPTGETIECAYVGMEEGEYVFTKPDGEENPFKMEVMYVTPERMGDIRDFEVDVRGYFFDECDSGEDLSRFMELAEIWRENLR